MEIAIFINLVLSAFMLVSMLSRARTPKALPASAPTALTLTPNPRHALVKVWDNRTCDHDRQGWWFECSCGLKRNAEGTNTKSYGSEEKAILSFKAHAKLHKGLVLEEINPFEKKYNEEHALFAEYRDKCFCKDTNDDLILMIANKVKG